jgi:hypothetical protein
LRQEDPEGGRDRALNDGTRNRNLAYSEEFLDVELQADAEHQQDDADFSELFCHRTVRHVARRVGPDEKAGDQVTDDRRQAQPLCEIAKDQGGGKTTGQREYEVKRVHVS